MTRTRRLIAALVVTLFALFGAVTATSPSAQASVPPKQVLVLGDSIVGGASNYIDFYMDQGGTAETTIKAIGGTALCDVLKGNGGPWTIDGLLAAKRYDAVVVAYSGNAITPCMQGRTGQAVVDKYAADADKFMNVTRFFGVPKVIWVQPFAARDAALNYVRTGLATLYRTLPAYWPSARVIDGGYMLENQGNWADILPCAPWDPCGYGVVRIGDPDGVHLWCDKRGPSYYGIVPPCDNYSAGSNRFGMNLSSARPFFL